MDQQLPNIFIFNAIYPERAAQEQADKKKLNAFGLLAKLNPFNRPKDNTVLLSQSVLRYEPFWEIEATRTVDYLCTVTYPVPVENPHANTVELYSQKMTVQRNGNKARIDIPVKEHCSRILDAKILCDGLNRDVNEKVLSKYSKYPHQEIATLDNPEALTPLISLTTLKQQIISKLQGEAINADEIFKDNIDFKVSKIYYRPVYAFEFVWSTADTRGVIEVDGLTGETSENGQWFKNKLEKIMTREMLIETGVEIANSILPGTGLAVRAIDKLNS
ncbi:hypothetical protein A203_00330 [Chromobacterium violaceum]|uniref:hypothetical protein n=1 Tax=Chromobacterium violaceum TaxID=536 RepID=UPI003CEF3663